jgi:phenylacetate-CoA ligase
MIDCRLPPEAIFERLQHIKFDVLQGFPGVLAQIAPIVHDQGLHLACPRVTMVGGEVLTPPMRRQISKAFGTPVFQTYGSHEFNIIAWECKKTGELHTCDDGMVVEILTDGRPALKGERGEVVGTNLHSFAMPFIRYRLGDIVTKGADTCPCGQPFSTIREVQGRMIDYFLLPGGKVVHPYAIVPTILRDGEPWVRQYQLIQERRDKITLKAVPAHTPTDEELARIRRSVRLLFGEGVEFHIVMVPEIKLEPSGKFRVSRSLVKSEYDGIDWDHIDAEN